MGKIFYIADTHFDHSNIIRLSNRPFENVEEMNEVIVKNWNRVVTNNDTVYIVGDFGYPKKAHQVPSLISIAKRLKGQKHIVVGNHDSKSILNPEFVAQFKSISNYLDINDSGTRVILFHYPIAEWNGFFRSSVHIHGHIHSDTNPNITEKENRYNVAADLLGFVPKTLEELRASR